MRQILYIFGTVLLCLTSYTGSLVAEEPTWSGFFGNCKKYVTQTVTGIKQDLKKNLELTQEDKKNIETIKEGLGQYKDKLDVLNKVVEVGVVDPIKTLANGGNTAERLKKQEDKKKLITVKTELIEKEREALIKKLKPYCPKGTTPEQLLDTAYRDADIKRQKRVCTAQKTRLSAEIRDLEKTIQASQELPRSGIKTTLLATGSLFCGVSAGLLTYLAIKKLLFRNCTNQTIKDKKAAVKKLVAEHEKLSKKISTARKALKRDDLTEKRREKAEQIIEEYEELENKIFWERVTITVMNAKKLVKNVTLPLCSIAASIAVTTACVSLWPSIWPATTPPQINTPADRLAKLKSDCAVLKTDLGKAEKEYANLEHTDRTIPHLPPEIQHAVTELKSVSGSLKNLENQAGAKEAHNVATIVDGILRTALGQ